MEEAQREEIMEEEKVPIMANSKTKASEIEKIPKVVVILLTIAISCFLLYFASYNNNLSQFMPSLGFASFYSINGSSSLGVNDEDYKELKRVLKKASTNDSTVILTTLNEAWAAPNSIFDLFLESFKIGNNTARLLNHLLVIAIDEKAYSRCQALVSHCYFLKSKESREMARAAQFMSNIYMEMMWRRQAFLQTVLSLGYNFVFTDTDVMWFRDPFPHFYPNVDFQTSCDYYNGRPSNLNNMPNNGFNYVRSNNRTVEFYKFWVSSRDKYPGDHEQNVFNRIKKGPFVRKLRLTIRFLDTNYFGGFCSPSKDFNKVCTMHANCCVGLDRKIPDLNTMLEDWKMYLSLSSNQTASQRSHWRVPHQCHM